MHLYKRLNYIFISLRIYILQRWYWFIYRDVRARARTLYVLTFNPLARFFNAELAIHQQLVHRIHSRLGQGHVLVLMKDPNWETRIFIIKMSIIWNKTNRIFVINSISHHCERRKHYRLIFSRNKVIRFNNLQLLKFSILHMLYLY